MVDDWIIRRELRRSFGQRERVSKRIVKGISRWREESPIPHQSRIETGIGCARRPPLVSRSSSVPSNDVVILNANGNRLTVAKSVHWRMTASTSVVRVESTRCVEPQKSSQVRERWVKGPSKTQFQSRLDSASETCRCKYGAELVVEVTLTEGEAAPQDRARRGETR